MKGDWGLTFQLYIGSVCRVIKLEVIINFKGALENHFKNCITTLAIERVGWGGVGKGLKLSPQTKERQFLIQWYGQDYDTVSSKLQDLYDGFHQFFCPSPQSGDVNHNTLWSYVYV